MIYVYLYCHWCPNSGTLIECVRINRQTSRTIVIQLKFHLFRWLIHIDDNHQLTVQPERNRFVSGLALVTLDYAGPSFLLKLQFIGILNSNLIFSLGAQVLVELKCQQDNLSDSKNSQFIAPLESSTPIPPTVKWTCLSRYPAKWTTHLDKHGWHCKK